MYICVDVCMHVCMCTCVHDIVLILYLNQPIQDEDPSWKPCVFWGSVVLCTYWAGVVLTYMYTPSCKGLCFPVTLTGSSVWVWLS